MYAIHTEGFDAALTLTDHIDHLPDRKRRELARIIEILFAGAEKFQATKLTEKRSAGKILKVILYGSYARGDWVEDRVSGYRSDYDLLIVVNSKAFAEEHELWEGIENELLTQQLSRKIETPVVPIVHDLNDVNDQLSRGRPFFVDVAKDGIILYEKPGHPLSKPKPLAAADARREAAHYYHDWSKSADAFQASASFLFERGDLKEAAFNLHQAAERLYHCTLLTLTLYSPKSHRLKLLRSHAEDLNKGLIAAWPRDTRTSRQRFELLSRAYVEARYSPTYKIDAHELAWLLEHVQMLQEIVRTVCKAHLSFDSAV
jgi:predicted nucleotidyltransferase/HEPN domain-containing protein